MAKLTINIPDEKVPRVLAALESRYAKNSGESDGAFAKRILIKFLKNVVIDYESKQASQDAAVAKRSKIITELGDID